MKNHLGILLLLLFSSCYYPCDYDPECSPENFKVLNLSVLEESKNIPADSFHTYTIYATLPAGIDSNKVTFRTETGTFSNNLKVITATADLIKFGVDTANQSIDSSRAVVLLKSPRLPFQNARVIASIAGIADTVNVSFSTAYPDTILLDAGVFTVSSGLDFPVTITALLKRDSGFVSLNQEVWFKAFNSDGNLIGVFSGLNNYSDEKGKVTVKFAPGSVPKESTIFIQGNALTFHNSFIDTVRSTISLIVK